MRVAHCSDLHLLSLNGARALDFVNKRWIGGLNLIANRGRHHRPEVFEAMVADFNRSAIDHVVVTGDITNLAFEEEFRFARRYFDAIELGPANVTVLPGNHDAYVARGAEYFVEHFDSYHRPDPDWVWPDGERWPVVRVRGDVAVIAVSTSLATPWFTAYGRIGDDQLQRMRTALSDPRVAGRFRLVAIHHPPAGTRAKSMVRGLRDRAAFASVIAEVGAELVIHGHEHLDLLEHLPLPAGGSVAVRGIQSGTYEAGNLERRARYRIYDVSPTAPGAARPALARDLVRVWDPARARFVAEDTPSGEGMAA